MPASNALTLSSLTDSQTKTRCKRENINGASGLVWIKLMKSPSQDAYNEPFNVNNSNFELISKNYPAKVVRIQLFFIG